MMAKVARTIDHVTFGDYFLLFSKGVQIAKHVRSTLRIAAGVAFKYRRIVATVTRRFPVAISFADKQLMHGSSGNANIVQLPEHD